MRIHLFRIGSWDIVASCGVGVGNKGARTTSLTDVSFDNFGYILRFDLVFLLFNWIKEIPVRKSHQGAF